MNRKAETFFDDIIKALTIEGESAKFANLSREVAAEFFSDEIVNAKLQTQPVPPININSPQVVGQGAVPSTNDLNTLDMPGLQAVALKCTKCPLCSGRKNVVFGTGNINADLMFIGEGPGKDEDIQGIPFVGEAGQLLTKMINAMQFTRSSVYIANIVKCRPPNNRNPEDDEAETCLPYLKRQIELVSPKVIVILGAIPLKYLLEKSGITKRRGLWDSYQGIKVMPTFHPAYLLRNPAAKRQVWEDLQKVMQAFGKTPQNVQQR